jgi:hypothetical protein
MARPTHSPYNFVPLPETAPERGAYPGLDRLSADSYSGLLVCDLKVLSRLFTADQRQGDSEERLLHFLRNSEANPIPILQATTLKGMIRSVYEAAFPSCLPLAAASGYSERVGGKVGYHWVLPAAYSHAACDHLDNLCPSCRLFGIAQGDKVHARGRVVFSDAALTEGALQQQTIKLSELSSPKPASEIYGRNGKIRGRKLYYHHDPMDQPEVETLGSRSNAISEFAPPDTIFTFILRFENLSKPELERLVACLTLDADHAHKLGMAKPLGYGSCTIHIREDASFVAQGGTRYQRWESEKDPFDETQWKIKDNWLTGALEKLLRWKRNGVGMTGYRLLQEYKDLDFDENGKYGQGKATPKTAALVPDFPQLQSSSEVIAAVLQLSQASAQRKAIPSPQQRKGKLYFEVLRIENGAYILRDPATGQDDIVYEATGVHLEIGKTAKIKILKTGKDGRIKTVGPA